MTPTEIRPGLEGLTVAETRLSDVDGEAGELVIAGFPVETLARKASFEETLFLLWNDRLPTQDEHAALRKDLAARRSIGPEVRAILERAAGEDVPAMDALRMGVAAASMDAEVADHQAQARRAVAVLPTIVGTYWRYREGAEPVAPRSDLGHAANALYVLTGESPADHESRGLETYLNTVVDHGLNASTFTARTVVSTKSDVISAVTGAVGALKGPLHGGAPGPVLEDLLAVHETGDPAGHVRETLAAGDRLMGFGHRVYRVRDPRAAVLSAAAEAFFAEAEDDFFQTVETYERVALDLLAEHKPDRDLETNVEFYTATILHGLEIPRDLFTAAFAMGRVGGWTAHCLEQLADNRLIRPVGHYVGAEDRPWIPRDERTGN
jgi:citrate synthase